MNRTQTASLCRVVKALCPSQTIDEFTPDAWGLVLDDIDYELAAEAVKRLGRMPLEPGKARYIEPGHIRGEVKRIRAELRQRSERAQFASIYEERREVKCLMGQTPPPGEAMKLIRELIAEAKPKELT